jgi:hypothetical protein
MKFLTLYSRWSSTGLLPDIGLCNSVPYELKDVLNDFGPTKEEIEELASEGLSKGCWGSGLPLIEDNADRRFYEFTPLRQTIILLCAALNGEFHKPVKRKK